MRGRDAENNNDWLKSSGFPERAAGVWYLPMAALPYRKSRHSMTRVTSALFPSSLLALGLVGTPAQAQSSRTHVSAANGNDANDCSRGTPCRTFQAAHDKTLADGEITVLDPGGYGGMIISKSISIV